MLEDGAGPSLQIRLRRNVREKMEVADAGVTSIWQLEPSLGMDAGCLESQDNKQWSIPHPNSVHLPSPSNTADTAYL